jgi:hypothetical protein
MADKTARQGACSFSLILFGVQSPVWLIRLRGINAGKRIVLGANEVVSFGFELIME